VDKNFEESEQWCASTRCTTHNWFVRHARSYVCHDLFYACVMSRLYECAMIYSCLSSDVRQLDAPRTTQMCDIWLVHVHLWVCHYECARTHSWVSHDSFTSEQWCASTRCNMHNSYVWHDSFMCVYECAMTHSWVSHDSFISEQRCASSVF